MRRGLAIAALGSLLGGAAATISAGFLRSLLFGVVAIDAPSLMSGIGLALVFSGLGCLEPAIRAATTDPATVLRSD